jgi:hypothetical protein
MYNYGLVYKYNLYRRRWCPYFSIDSGGGDLLACVVSLAGAGDIIVLGGW